MILILAKIQCDHVGCQASGDIQLEFRVGSQGVPVLTPCDKPESWTDDIEYGYGFGGEREIHLCPEHPANRGY